MSQQPNNLETPDYTMTSASAVSSMIFGIASPLGVCTCLAPPITSLCAIILGHISLSKIKRSEGRLQGKVQAMVGLILGYISLPLSIGLIMVYYNGIGSVTQNSAPSALDNAEIKLVGLRQGEYTGNNPQANHLANTYGQLLSTLIQQTILDKNDNSVDDKVSVFCNVNDDSVCFLVKIPDYRNYNDEAKEGLAEMAWKAGQITVSQSSMPEPTELAVGLKGLLLYGAVMTGDAQGASPQSNGVAKAPLNRFFPSETPLN